MFISREYWAPINAWLVLSLTILTFVGDGGGGCKTDIYDCKNCRFSALMFMRRGYRDSLNTRMAILLTILTFVDDSGSGCKTDIYDCKSADSVQ